MLCKNAVCNDVNSEDFVFKSEFFTRFKIIDLSTNPISYIFIYNQKQ